MKDVKCTRGVYIHRSKDHRIALKRAESGRNVERKNRIVKVDSSFRFCFPWQPSSVIPLLHCLSPLTKRAWHSQPLLRRDRDRLAQTNHSDLQMNVSFHSFPFLSIVFLELRIIELVKVYQIYWRSLGYLCNDRTCPPVWNSSSTSKETINIFCRICTVTIACMTLQTVLILSIIKYSGFLWLGEFYI